jgi:hypothetical protein
MYSYYVNLLSVLFCETGHLLCHLQQPAIGSIDILSSHVHT